MPGTILDVGTISVNKETKIAALTFYCVTECVLQNSYAPALTSNVAVFGGGAIGT